MGKIVLITGVAGGIGRATASLFFQQGWEVIGLDKVDACDLTDVSHAKRVDIADYKAVTTAIKDVQNLYGRIDALVNNAAIQVRKPLIHTSLEEWESTFATNVTGAFHMIRQVYPLLRQYGGSVINVCSVHALATSVQSGAYAASKSALLGLTRVAALELAPYRIRVNAVLPGAIDTPMLRSGLNVFQGDQPMDRLLNELGDRHVLNRIGRPEEVAEAILFLASPQQSSFITGQALVIDGGATIRLSTETMNLRMEEDESVSF